MQQDNTNLASVGSHEGANAAMLGTFLSSSMTICNLSMTEQGEKAPCVGFDDVSLELVGF
jgi:hypothetical protein